MYWQWLRTLLVFLASVPRCDIDTSIWSTQVHDLSIPIYNKSTKSIQDCYEANPSHYVDRHTLNVSYIHSSKYQYKSGLETREVADYSPFVFSMSHFGFHFVSAIFFSCQSDFLCSIPGCLVNPAHVLASVVRDRLPQPKPCCSFMKIFHPVIT